MRKIRNPYVDIQGYNCFACAPHNDIGLKMEFFEDGEEVCCLWQADQRYQGYKNVLHGGIQATLMDELAAWYIQVKLRTSGVTTAMTTRFKKPVMIDNGKILLKASLKETEKRQVHLAVDLYDSQGNLCTESEVTYVISPESYARRQLLYPGYDKFFND